MKKKLFVNVFVLLFCVTTITPAQKITRQGGKFKTVIEKSYNVSPGGTLEIKNVTGDITVSSWNKNSVEIHEELVMDVYTEEEAQESLSRKIKGYSQKGNVILINGRNGSESVSSDFEVHVPKKFNLDLSTRGGDLAIMNLEGNVKAETSGGDIAAMDLNGVLELTTSGGDLSFKDIAGRLKAITSGGDIELANIFCEADLSTSGGDIELLKATQRVSLNTSGGDVEAADVEGNLNINTSGGDIQISNCSGANVSVNTSGGEIEMQNIKGEISASTSGGDITGEKFYSHVSASTSGGDIKLQDVQAGISAITTGGDVDAEITLKDFSKPHKINLQTTGGDIDITLPAKLPATINAEIRLDKGGRFFQRYDIYSDFPLTKSKPSERGDRVLKSTGDINGGGDKVELKTNGGDINIHKAK